MSIQKKLTTKEKAQLIEILSTRFEKNILIVSTKEINDHTDIHFTYKPIYGDRPGRGRKPVVEVEFQVAYQAKTEPVTLSQLHEKLVKKFRLRPDQAQEVIDNHSAEVINRQLYDVEIKVADGKVKNIGSYTAKVFGLVITKKAKE